jgi:malate dehydrogenase (oxaloacetate-decarboxylating)
MASDIPLKDHRIVLLGAGTAGVGIIEQIIDAMKRDGLSEAEALSRCWLVDRPGLLTDQVECLPFQTRFAHKRSELANWSLQQNDKINLYDVVKNIKPTILIGCSTVTGAFNQEIVQLMHASTERPIIMPLSNPTSLSEASPEDLLRWTDGKAIIATGSPFGEVFYDGRRIRIAQSNNALAFPGIGLGTIAAKAKHLTDDMLWAATQALAECSPVMHDKMAPLLPKLSETHMVSYKVAVAVAEAARQAGIAGVPPDVDLKQRIRRMMWEPRYMPYQKI